MTNKQAVIETSAGTIVIALLPDAAPNHVGLFMKIAREGGYDGTTFHRVIKYGLIQGGDPLTKDPANIAKYGQGGLKQLRREPNAEKHTSGAVSAVMVPGDPNSAGAQFFICSSDQPALDGQFDVFARVIEGIEIVQQISTTDADANGIAKTRVVINKVTIRDTPAVPFVNESAAELSKHRATVETTMGAIELEMLADKAPETVRQFLRWRTGRYLRRHQDPSRRPELRDSDRRARVPRQAADDGAERAREKPAARVHRDAESARHRLDRAWRRPRQRLDIVLHLHRRVPGIGREVHGVRESGCG
jgi:cyclophilin family peptidyl-prolyl cis-trans isomerase